MTQATIRADAPKHSQKIAQAVELTDEDLETVTGGRKAGDKSYEFLTVKLEEVFIT